MIKLEYLKVCFINVFVFCLIDLFPILFLCSCGHNVVTVSKGVGINFSWDGSNYVPNVKLGQWDQITYVVRGNSSAATTTVTGGNLGTGGIAQTIAFNSGTQLN